MFGSWIRPSPDPFLYPNTRTTQVGRAGDRHQWAPDLAPGAVLQSQFAPTWEGAALFHGRLEPRPVTELSILSVAAQPSQTARPQQNTEKRMFDGKIHPQVTLDYWTSIEYTA